MTIHLKNIILGGFHGLYVEEKILGNQFVLNLWFNILPMEETITMNNSIDYVALFKSVEQQFLQREDLLENLCKRINRFCFDTYPQIQSIKISICKQQVPILNFQGSIAISLEEKRYKGTIIEIV